METIKKLLTDGVVTIEEVLEYAETYQRAMDAFNDAQINKYYDVEYGQNQWPEDCQDTIDEERQLRDAMMSADQEMEQSRSDNPEYIIASTSRALEETLIFESDADGLLLECDYGGISCRYNPELDWTDSDLAVTKVFGEGVFERISEVTPNEKGYFVIYKRKQIN